MAGYTPNVQKQEFSWIVSKSCLGKYLTHLFAWWDVQSFLSTLALWCDSLVRTFVEKFCVGRDLLEHFSVSSARSCRAAIFWGLKRKECELGSKQ